MHPSFVRLLECARTASADWPAARRVVRPGDLKHALGESAATITNWKGPRGVSTNGAMKAARLFGCSAQWILDGTQPEAANHAAEGLHFRPVAQELSHSMYNHAPKHIAWEALMSTALGHEFQTELVDASMSPDLPPGSRVILVTGTAPEPGDFVLVADRHGNHYLREYRVLRPGVWQAHAINSAFLPLDHTRDGLRVIAVYDGVRGRRSKR